MFKRVISSIICLVLFLSPIPKSSALDFNIDELPSPGSLLRVSASFSPILIKGMVFHPDKPFDFDFIIDSGNDVTEQAVLQLQSARMVKYFLAAVTVPDHELWVNLSPFEKTRIVNHELGITVLGRDMLAQDYVLKQLTASIIYPESQLGKKFWARIYREAQQRFGTSKVPVDVYNKIWILPQSAQVFEKNNSVYVTQARLGVMLDSDYKVQPKEDEKVILTKKILRSMILPVIEKEVNEGQNFAVLRQIYYAAILAKWYREKVKGSMIDKSYVGKNKIFGLKCDDQDSKQKIYGRYIQAYKKGVFNYVKEIKDRTSGLDVPRKYFSGGLSNFAMKNVQITRVQNTTALKSVGESFLLSVKVKTSCDAGMKSVPQENLQGQNIRIFKGINYPNAVTDPKLKGKERNVKAVIVDAGYGKLAFTAWSSRKSDDFNEREELRLEHPDPIDEFAKWEARDIGSIRHTIFDKSSGLFDIKAIIQDKKGQEHFYRIKAGNTTKMNIRRLIPPIEEMKAPGAYLQASMGNQGDLIGNFTLISKGSTWEVFGAANEDRLVRTYRSLIQYTSGTKKLAVIELQKSRDGSIAVDLLENNTVRKIDPQEVDFILVAHPLIWSNEDQHRLLEETYLAQNDLRNVLRLPTNAEGVQLFYGQIAQNAQYLRSALNERVLKLESQDPALDQGNTLSEMLNSVGYHKVDHVDRVKKPGDYSTQDNKVFIIILPARYPINVMLVGGDGRIGFVEVIGISGRKGVNFWTVGDWVRKQAREILKWDPQAAFVLDSGMDPTLISYKNKEDQKGEFLAPAEPEKRVRFSFNASLSVVDQNAAMRAQVYDHSGILTSRDVSFDQEIKDLWTDRYRADYLRVDPQQYQRREENVFQVMFNPTKNVAPILEPNKDKKVIHYRRAKDFVFTKAPIRTRLMELYLNHMPVTLIADINPIFKYHFLFLPELEKRRLQLLNERDILATLQLARKSNDPNLKFMHNSFGGGGGEVNNLHIHGLYYPRKRTPMENAKTSIVTAQAGLTISELEGFPTKGFVFEGLDENIARASGDLVKHLQRNNIPYDVWMMKNKVYVLPRRLEHVKVRGMILSFGAFEMAGNIIVTSKDLYDSLTAQEIRDALADAAIDQLGFDRLKEYILQAKNNYAMSDRTVLNQSVYGGIDLNKIKIGQRGRGASFKFDQVQISELESLEFDGFYPVFSRISRKASPLQCLML